jgi:hypothetical protein
MFLYFVPNKASELFVPIPLDRLKLEFQAFVFETTMINNVTKILKKDCKKMQPSKAHMICLCQVPSYYSILA